MLRGAELIGAARDRTFPMPDGPWPGIGAVLAAIETATGAGRATRRQARARAVPAGARPARATGRVVAVGDRLDADVAGAARGRARRRARADRRDGRAEAARRADAAPRSWPNLAELVLGDAR